MTDLTCNLKQVPSIACSYFWCCSVTQTCQTLVTSCTARTQGSPAIQISQSFIQTHDLWVNDAFQPSHPLSFPSSPALNLSQHQFLPSDFPLGLKRLIYGSSCAASVLLRIIWNHFLHTLLVWTPFSPVFSSPPVVKRLYFGSQFLCSCSLLCRLLLKINFDHSGLFQ